MPITTNNREKMRRLSLSNKEVHEARTSQNSSLFVVPIFIVAAVYCVDIADRETTLSTQIHT